jgi:predicted RNase H-like HicB family nuclease
MAKSRHDIAINLSRLGYTLVLLRDKTTDGDCVYIALNPELEGCMAQGLTEIEAIENLDEIRVEHIEHLLEYHLPVPTPNHATASSTISNEVVFTHNIRNIAFPGFESLQSTSIQAEERELVYSIDPNK